MIVGRAVNGALSAEEDCWFPADVSDLSVAKDLAGRSLALAGEDPLAWVATAGDAADNPRRSAFWRSARRLLEIIEGDTFSANLWSNRLAWTNLYKIAPAEAGNPKDSLCWSQFQQCNRILRREVEDFRPEKIVFITGQDWLDWFQNLADDKWLYVTPHGGEHVTGMGIVRHEGGTSASVVARRPDSRSSGSSEESWAREVSGAFAHC